MPTKTKFSYIHADDETFRGLLKNTLLNFEGVTAQYSSLFRDYYHLYIGNRLIKDLSFFAMADKEEILAYVPLYLCKVNESIEFSWVGQYLRAPVFCIGENSTRRSEIEKDIFNRIEILALEHGAELHKTEIEPTAVFSGETTSNFLLNYGYQDETSGSAITELTKSEEELWQKLRKTYRHLIKKAEAKFQVTIIDRETYSHEMCEKYRLLHREAAGRETRPRETFEKMYEMIQKDEAFLVGVSKEGGDWLGVYLFIRLKGNVFYGSSATSLSANRNEGFGHLGIWSAMKYSRLRGDHFFEMGWQPSDDEPGVDEKIMNIALFKSGFGSERITWFRGTKYFKRKVTK